MGAAIFRHEKTIDQFHYGVLVGDSGVGHNVPRTTISMANERHVGTVFDLCTGQSASSDWSIPSPDCRLCSLYDSGWYTPHVGLWIYLQGIVWMGRRNRISYMRQYGRKCLGSCCLLPLGPVYDER